MKFDENFAPIHAYLCADGYVVKNPVTQKHKYYRIGFRNTNLILLKDFQNKFKKVFRIKPRLIIGQRCEIGSKEIYELLTKEFGSFYSREWQLPELKEKLLPFWLRAFFDCEGWVYVKSHQNRQIGLDCVNEKGIDQVRMALKKLGINSIKKYRKKKRIFRIFIYGKENLFKFKEQVGFIHPEKTKKLTFALKDYVVYKWAFPKEKEKCKKFIKKILKEKVRIKDKRYLRIFSKERENLNKLGKLLFNFYKVRSLFYERLNGLGTRYYELNINRREDVEKLIKERLIKNIFKTI